jgi:hypothetical protein
MGGILELRGHGVTEATEQIGFTEQTNSVASVASELTPWLSLKHERCRIVTPALNGWTRLTLMMRGIMLKKSLYAIAYVLMTGSMAWAQVDRATLTGIVRDPQNAVVPSATVKLTNVATGVEATTNVTGDGTYLIVNLAPGEYVVEVSATGFQSSSQTIRLETGQRARLDVGLAVGGVGETVRVEGVTPILDTQSAVVGSVVSRNEVANLPLAIRNWDDLLFTLPGVQGDRYTEQTGTTNAGRTGGVSIHATDRCRTTSSSTASTTTRSRRTFRSCRRRSRVRQSTRSTSSRS